MSASVSAGNSRVVFSRRLSARARSAPRVFPIAANAYARARSRDEDGEPPNGTRSAADAVAGIAAFLPGLRGIEWSVRTTCSASFARLFGIWHPMQSSFAFARADCVSVQAFVEWHAMHRLRNRALDSAGAGTI